MIEGWLAAAAKRRGGSVAPVALVENIGSNTDNQVTFSATPSNDELIVLVACTLNGGAATFTWPAGFTEQVIVSTAGRPLGMATKVASGEASAVYEVTNTVGGTRCIGYRLSGQGASPIGNTGTFTDGAGATTVPAASSAIAVSAGSIVIAAWNGASTYTYTPDNSFGGVVTGGSGRIGSGYRIYSAEDTAQNCTATRSGSASNRRGGLLEILT